MLIEEPYKYDYELYGKLPIKDRWIMNKLHVAEVMGHNCGPSGTFPKEHGTYCLRPVHNVRGMYNVGFYKIEYTGNGEDLIKSGYFWCEWFDGERSWTEYVNDEVSNARGGIEDEYGILVCEDVTELAMEKQFRGISRYMLIERIDGKVIEVAPRLMGVVARQEIIDDYKTIDASYDPTDIRMGPSVSKLITLSNNEFIWEDVKETF